MAGLLLKVSKHNLLFMEQTSKWQEAIWPYVLLAAVDPPLQAPSRKLLMRRCIEDPRRLV